MRPNGLQPETSLHAATASAILSFADAQSREGAAKIMGFFHLAEARRAKCVDFRVDASGGIELIIKIDGGLRATID